jgi:uncharacterized protein
MSDKISNYNIEIEYANCILLYNTLSNNLLPIQCTEYAIIETLLEYLPEFKNKYPELYQGFKKSGFIIPDGFNEFSYIKLQNKQRIFIDNDYRITVNPTLDCNLKCWYCSVKDMGAQHAEQRMDDEIINCVNKHIDRLITLQKPRSLQIDWFGGEPTLYFNEVILKIAPYAKKIAEAHHIPFRQIMTTNATLLNTEWIKKMGDLNFTAFQITLDGNRTRHNKIKYYSDRKGAYEDAINNINLIAEIIPHVHITLRINFDRQTLKHIGDICDDLSPQAKKCISVDLQQVWQIQCTDRERELIKAAKENFHKAGMQLIAGVCQQPKKFHHCYADCFRYYLINYDGSVYKCTAHGYDESSMIGHLQSSGDIQWNNQILSTYYEKATFENPMCESCKMLPLCMGPCIQRNYEACIAQTPLKCLFEEDLKHSVSSYVIDTTKKRHLID